VAQDGEKFTLADGSTIVVRSFTLDAAERLQPHMEALASGDGKKFATGMRAILDEVIAMDRPRRLWPFRRRKVGSLVTVASSKELLDMILRVNGWKKAAKGEAESPPTGSSSAGSSQGS